MARERVVLLGRDNASTALLYNALSKSFDTHVIHEKAPSTYVLLRSRIKRLGVVKVIGQVLFQVLVAKPLFLLSGSRRRAILAEFGASEDPVPVAVLTNVDSVNSTACWVAVEKLAPSVVVINGTRILSKGSIARATVPILNTHVGMTPRYRGVHGAYWALAQNDPEHCGVTVHLVDEGIDTGSVLYQARIHPTAADNFTTYPLLQMAIGSGLLVKAVKDVVKGRTIVIEGPSGDRRWYHPTLWEYLANRITKGVR